MDRHTVTPQVDGLPGDRACRWVEHHHRRAAPSTYVYEFVWDVDAPAIGPFCTDVDGNVLLDFTGHVGSAPLGYNNPKILEPMREFDLVDPLKIAGQDFYVATGDDPTAPGPTGLMDRLADACSHYGMDTVFLSNSGAEAIENAVKICYDHTAGKYGITFVGGFHGRTLGALSLNRSKELYRRRFPEIGGVHDVPFCQNRHCDADTCSCGFFFDDTSRLRRMLDPGQGYVNDDEVAFVILEPIQGEGGYNIPSEEFMAEIGDLCATHDLLLVADEIQSGLGRTGELWASDHYPIEPDVIAAAKGLRVGATVARQEIFPERRARLSSTWGAGDILASIQGSLTLDAVHEHDLLENATERGRHAVEALRDAGLTNAVDIRGKGLMLAVEFDTPDRRDAVVEAAFERGLLTLGCGYRTVRLLPPLDVTEREIDLGVSLLVEAAETVT